MLMRSLISSIILSFLFPIAINAMPICEFQIYKLSSNYQSDLKLRSMQNQLALAEEEAIKAIFNLVLNEDAELTLLNEWIHRLEQKTDSLNVAEHSALSFLFRNPDYLGIAIENTDRQELLNKVSILLKKSWSHLTGEDVSIDHLGNRLPRKLLDGQPNKVLMFYQTSFNEYKSDGTSTLNSIFHQLISTNAEYKKFITTMIVTAMAMTLTGGEAIGLGISGLVLQSLAENWFHRYLAHASEKFLNSLQKIRMAVKTGFYKSIKLTAFNHKGVHHGAFSFREDDAVQFQNRDEMLKSDSVILKRAGQKFLDRMKKNGYGYAISASQYTTLISPFIMLTVIGLTIGVDPVHLGLVLGPGYFYPIGLFSNEDHNKRYEEGGTLRPDSYGLLTFHEYSHLKQQELDRILVGKPLVKRVLSSKLSEILRGVHWVHHDKPDLNFNLTNYIADVLMGTLSLMDMEKLAEMDRDNNLGYYWGASLLSPE